MTRPCPICSDRHSRPRHRVRGFTLLECMGCQGWFLQDDGARVDYGGDYLRRSDADVLSGYYDYEAERALHLRNFQDNLDILREHDPGPTLLDVGCASGHFLQAAAAGGFEVSGIDPSPEAVRQVQEHGLRAQVGLVEEIERPEHMPEGGFDVITMWETIEHIHDPLPALQRVRSWLKPGGLFAVGTGDNRSPLARALGARWWYIIPPDHVVYYNPKALNEVVRRAGFVDRSTHRVNLHRVSSRNVGMKLLRSFQVPAQRALSVARRLPDQDLPVLHGTTVVVVGRSPETQPI